MTPSGNATERHLCRACRAEAEERFPNRGERADFWREKLKISAQDAQKLLEDPVKFEAKIRSATMKQGGVGYLAPNPEPFPTLETFNEFIIRCDAIPAITWLNDLSQGEADVDELLDLHVKKGAAMLNIIPDRNLGSARGVAELDRIAACCERDLPVSSAPK